MTVHSVRSLGFPICAHFQQKECDVLVLMADRQVQPSFALNEVVDVPPITQGVPQIAENDAKIPVTASRAKVPFGDGHESQFFASFRYGESLGSCVFLLRLAESGTGPDHRMESVSMYCIFERFGQRSVYGGDGHVHPERRNSIRFDDTYSGTIEGAVFTERVGHGSSTVGEGLDCRL